MNKEVNIYAENGKYVVSVLYDNGDDVYYHYTSLRKALAYFLDQVDWDDATTIAEMKSFLDG